MASIINRQPVFTNTPILYSNIINPPINNNLYDISSGGNYTVIYEASDDCGTLIERITISATGDLVNNVVNAKLIYLGIIDEGKVGLYKTGILPNTTITASTPNPEIEWVFTGGIILPKAHSLIIAASTNYDNTLSYGDYISITIEGSLYTKVE